jgi:hypothetical protein
MENYRKAGPARDWPSSLADGRLGKAVGCYRNPGPDGEVVGIFADGMAWHESGHLIEVRFADLTDVKLPNEKQSLGLSLHLRDGRQLELPVKGHVGQFYDSLEMLRFVRRVMGDVQRPAATG